MESGAIDRKMLACILEGAAIDMKEHIDELRELDAELGDGDLGITTGLAMDAVLRVVRAGVEDDPAGLLGRCGTSIRKASPSTFGTLLGSAFIEAGRAVAGRSDLAAGDLAAMGWGAIAAIRKWGKSEVGDKTMLDALAPAVEAFESRLEQGEGAAGLEQALRDAVAAARWGMEATIPLRAKHGRTSWHQEKSVGVLDAGAAAIYYLIEAFARRTLAYARAEEDVSDR